MCRFILINLHYIKNINIFYRFFRNIFRKWIKNWFFIGISEANLHEQLRLFWILEKSHMNSLQKMLLKNKPEQSNIWKWIPSDKFHSLFMETSKSDKAMQLWFIFVKSLIRFQNIIMGQPPRKEQKQINSFPGISITSDLHFSKSSKSKFMVH